MKHMEKARHITAGAHHGAGTGGSRFGVRCG